MYYFTENKKKILILWFTTGFLVMNLKKKLIYLKSLSGVDRLQ